MDRDLELAIKDTVEAFRRAAREEADRQSAHKERLVVKRQEEREYWRAVRDGIRQMM